jgi:hypothetical protein
MSFLGVSVAADPAKIPLLCAGRPAALKNPGSLIRDTRVNGDNPMVSATVCHVRLSSKKKAPDRKLTLRPDRCMRKLR